MLNMYHNVNIGPQATYMHVARSFGNFLSTMYMYELIKAYYLNNLQ